MTRSQETTAPVHLVGAAHDKSACGFVGTKQLTEIRGRVTCKRCLRWIAANMRTGGLVP